MALIARDGNLPGGQRGIHRVFGLDFSHCARIGSDIHSGFADVVRLSADNLAGAREFNFNLIGVQIKCVELGLQGIRYIVSSHARICERQRGGLLIVLLCFGMLLRFSLQFEQLQNCLAWSVPMLFRSHLRHFFRSCDCRVQGILYFA